MSQSILYSRTTKNRKRAVSIDEAASMLSVSPRTIWRLVSDQRLRVVRLGRRVLVPVDAIDALLRAEGSTT